MGSGYRRLESLGPKSGWIDKPVLQSKMHELDIGSDAELRLDDVVIVRHRLGAESERPRYLVA